MIGHIGESRTVGYAAHGAAGMLMLFVRGMLCNWMVSAGVVGAMISTNVTGKVIATEAKDGKSAETPTETTVEDRKSRVAQPGGGSAAPAQGRKKQQDR